MVLLLLGWVARSRRTPVPLVVAGHGLEQLDQVAGRIVDEDLTNRYADHNVGTQPDPGLTQGLDSTGEIGDLESHPVPSSRLRQGPIGQCMGGARHAEQETEI